MSEQRMWFCPVCGKTAGRRITKRLDRYVVAEYSDYLKTIDFDPNKPFGVALETLGRGKGKRVIRYLEPADMPSDFEQVKDRLLDVVKEWIDKGWLKRTEL